MNDTTVKTAPADEKKAKTQKVLSILIIVALALMVPVLIVNCTLIIKSFVNPDVPPSIFGLTPQYLDEDIEKYDMKKGDMIIVKSADVEDIEVGDIIVFTTGKNDGKIVFQTVETILKDSDGNVSGWQTESPDGVFKGSTVMKKNLVGEYKGTRIPVLGAIATFTQTIPGIIVCMAIPLGLLIAYEVVCAKKKEKESDSEKSELLAELEELRRAKEQAEAQSSAEEAPTDDGEDA